MTTELRRQKAATTARKPDALTVDRTTTLQRDRATPCDRVQRLLGPASRVELTNHLTEDTEAAASRHDAVVAD